MARELALKVLVDVLKNGAYSNIELNNCLGSNDLKSCDRAFITEIVYGVLKYKERIDYVIGKFSKIKLKKISDWILNILRIGIYQLMFMDRVPVSAAVNESVKLAKRYGHAYSAKFVNGVLRSVAGGIDNIVYPDEKNEPLEYLSVWYSYPKWLVKKCLEDFGYEFTKDFLESSNKKPNFCVRVNLTKTTVDDLVKLLKKEGIIAQKSKIYDRGLIIQNPGNITNNKLYKEGYFTIQDESSMLVANILNPSRGDMVLDVCAAPGGKTTHIAELMENTGCVYSRDLYEHKVLLIEKAAERLGLSNIKAGVFDAQKLDVSMCDKMDIVLVDAPCTGLGIIRRKPDIKWKKEICDVGDISNTQYKILKNASKYVKNGGHLVYSTCTIEREENIYIINKFLKEHTNFVPVDITDRVPKDFMCLTAKEGYIELYPNVHKIDGFFIAKMKKISRD